MPLIERHDLITVEPEIPASACIIWLHGLGADGYDFVSITPYLNERLGNPGIRYLFPHAPQRPVTIADGQTMRSWYDIMAMAPKRTIDPDQLADSVNRVYQLVEEQMKAGIEPQKIVIAGFSQGGAVAYQAASSCAHTLGGLIAMSTYVPDASVVNPFFVNAANQQLPVFIGHGLYDQVVPLTLAEQALSQLQSHGLQPEWHTYPIQHEVARLEVDDIARFLQNLLRFCF